jgi:hypothetical protein
MEWEAAFSEKHFSLSEMCNFPTLLSNSIDRQHNSYTLSCNLTAKAMGSMRYSPENMEFYFGANLRTKRSAICEHKNA